MHQSKTDAELKELSLGLRNGRYFCDQMCERGDVPMVFMVLSMMSAVQLEELQAKGPQMFYEEISKAGPRSVNGLPSFLSVQYLDEDEFSRFRTIDEGVRLFMQADPTPVEAPGRTQSAPGVQCKGG